MCIPNFQKCLDCSALPHERLMQNFGKNRVVVSEDNKKLSIPASTSIFVVFCINLTYIIRQLAEKKILDHVIYSFSSLSTFRFLWRSLKCLMKNFILFYGEKGHYLVFFPFWWFFFLKEDLNNLKKKFHCFQSITITSKKHKN